MTSSLGSAVSSFCRVMASLQLKTEAVSPAVICVPSCCHIARLRAVKVDNQRSASRSLPSQVPSVRIRSSSVAKELKVTVGAILAMRSYSCSSELAMIIRSGSRALVKRVSSGRPTSATFHKTMFIDAVFTESQTSAAGFGP